MKKHPKPRAEGAANRRRLWVEALEDRRLLAVAPADVRFDFGTRNSPVETGFSQVSQRTSYNAAAGYGWLTGGIRSADRRTGSHADRDFNYLRAGVFGVDVANGLYEVDITLGDLGIYRHDRMGVELEGVAADEVTTQARELARRTYQTEVDDGQLTLRLVDLGGSDAYVVIESLQIRSLGPALPRLSIADAVVVEGDSGSQVLSLNVAMSAPSADLVFVDYTTTEGSATTADNDFQQASGRLQFSPGDTSAQVHVSVFGDTTPEFDESFFVSLTTPVNATIGDAKAEAVIRNNDVAQTLMLSASPAIFSESAGANASRVTATRTGDLSSPLTVNLTHDGGGLITLPDTVRFAVDAETAEVWLAANDDDVFAGDLLVRLFASAADYLGDRIDVTVQENDQPPFSKLFDFGTGRSPLAAAALRVKTSGYSAGYGWTLGSIRAADRRIGSALERDFHSTKDGTFEVNVPDGRYQVDLTLGDLGRNAHDSVAVYLESIQRAVVSTAAGQMLTVSREVEVTDGSLTLRLRDLGGRDRYATIAALAVSSLGPPLPILAISDAQLTEGNSGSQNLTFDVTLSAPSDEVVTVQYATADVQATAGDDYVAGSGTLSFAPGETAIQTTVAVYGDEEAEGDETFAVNLANPLSANLGDATGVGTIFNDDIAKVLTITLAPAAISEAGGVAEATLHRTGPTDLPLLAVVQGSDDAQASAPDSIWIPPGSSSVVFPISVENDDDTDGTQTVTFTASAAGFADGTASLDVIDDETPPFDAFFDFGRVNSPVADGYLRVFEGSNYTPAAGFGWISGDPRSFNRGGTSALQRDLVYGTDMTFAVDLPDGSYRVDMLWGDQGSSVHDNMGVYLEGALRDTVSTAPGQIQARSYVVDVTGGRLTIRWADFGGRDRFAAVAGLRILPAAADPSDYEPWWPAFAGINGMFSEAYAANGFTYFDVDTPYQSSTNNIRVLLPSDYSDEQLYQVIYVLPVELGNRTQFGDGLTTIRNLGLADRHDVIFVAPSFSLTPWFVDHVSRQDLWQETYFRTVVVPFVEEVFSTSGSPADRLLLGFSKSGYGALSMLLRHPEEFGKASIWDAPLGMSNPGDGWDFLKILGSRQNFAQNYQITSLLPRAAASFQDGPSRIFLLGWSYNDTRDDHAAIDRLMTQLNIPHRYQVGVKRSHVWASGWIPDAVDALLDET